MASATLSGPPDRAKRPKYSTNKVFDKLGIYSNLPKAADTMIEAHPPIRKGSLWDKLRLSR